MSRIFVDTSAILALLVQSDAAHKKAAKAFQKLSSQQSSLLSSSYVLVETYALLTRRIGLDAARAFRDDFSPLLQVIWVDENLHNKGLERLLKSGSKKLSLVDTVSFEIMAREKITDAFTYDRHFINAGFSKVE